MTVTSRALKTKAIASPPIIERRTFFPVWYTRIRKRYYFVLEAHQVSMATRSPSASRPRYTAPDDSVRYRVTSLLTLSMALSRMMTAYTAAGYLRVCLYTIRQTGLNNSEALAHWAEILRSSHRNLQLDRLQGACSLGLSSRPQSIVISQLKE